MLGEEGGSDVVIYGPEAKDLAPIAAQKIRRCQGMNAVRARVVVEHVRDGNLGPLGGPKNDPVLERIF